MKKDKLIEYLKGQTYADPELEPVAGNNDYHTSQYKKGFNSAMEFSLSKIDQLEVPELPVIPQFVADYIDSARRENATLLGAMDHFLNSKEIKSWMRVNQELFAKAWLSKDGYTIEPQPIKTRQVLVKFFDNEEYKTELTEDAARELIEFLEANKK